MTESPISIGHASIREQFVIERQAGKRHRDIAEKLQISEGALIAAHAGAQEKAWLLQATRLQADWPALMKSLEPLGEVMALTRNISCVHEKTGVYKNVSDTGHVGLVLGGDIDLRAFYSHWAHGFAVSETVDNGVQQSLQFFDAQGAAIHKVFIKPQSDVEAYKAFVKHFADENQKPGITTVPAPPLPVDKADSEIHVAGFQAAWRALQDTHDFFGLLKRYGVSRLQSMRLAEKQYVRQANLESARELLETAATEGVALMIFVANPGMVQIHSGIVKKVAVMGPWLNVLDPGFNLHLREDHIASAWVVRKPTVDGLVTALELFDAEGNVIAMFFGERKPGKPELAEWRALVETLLKDHEPCLN
ncbi:MULTISPECIES: hemin-degrading factor [unclassified Methylophilus]|uniref:hemin-degrading factor n=1 Tax=unclassified Methylophilus TaxID=2630143 RepID=UPI0006F71528|nr:MULTISPECIES: hemin-degrading factor [unclassified Methylophilus]KQT42314.1 heme ABC transporter [Methylophilus sp. Leaf416]KQT56496.1 heme ABC transporter [Methylophilus sp. Leaf459]